MTMLRIILYFLLIRNVESDGFVQEVACRADGMTVMLNKNDVELASWIADKSSQPVVYVYDHKTRVPCGSSLKNEKGEINYNLTIPFGKQCDVLLADLEPNYRSAETTIALEDNGDTSLAKNLRINHVFCLFTRSVQTIKFNDVSSGNEVVASTGGKPRPRVEMLFRSQDGKPLRAAKFGDTVEFYVALSPDQAYHGIWPKECMFSDREDMFSPEARHVTFVQSGCPVNEMSDVIDPLANVNQEVYFSKFKTFRFGNQSTVFAHCTVQVCLVGKECVQDCFKRVHNSNLTADRLRFRHRRDIGQQKWQKGWSRSKRNANDTDEVSVTRTLTILNDDESIEVAGASHSVEQCLVTSSTSMTLVVVICALSGLVVVSMAIAIYFYHKMRQGRKESFDLYSSTYSTASVTMPVTYGHPRHPYVHHLGDNYR